MVNPYPKVPYHGKDTPGATETKHCIGCDEELPLEAFYYNSTLNRHATRCKTCDMALHRKRTLRNRKRYFEYLSQQSCMDCGIEDPIVLTHDHRDPKDKHNKVSAMIDSNSWKKIQIEIAKCDVVCANCHARRTAKMQGWYKDVQ